MAEQSTALRLADALNCVRDDDCGYCQPCVIAAQQALEAMRRGVPTGDITLAEWYRAIAALEGALEQELKPLNGLTKEEALAWARGLRADSPEYCSCGDRLKVACPGEREPGCDLGNNPRYAKRVNLPLGCGVCGLGSNGEVTGYVCQRTNCPTRVTCGGSA